MTIRATRMGAVMVGAAGAFSLVVVGAGAVLLNEPRLFGLLALLVVVDAFALVVLLRPLSATVEGTALVYRAGSRETRIRLSEIAGCALAGRLWVFSDSAGAHLLGLPALRFKDTDVSALCSQAAIPLGRAHGELPSGRTREAPERAEFFAHEDWRQELTGAAVLLVIVAVPVGFFIVLAVYFSPLVWGALAGAGIAFYAYQLFEVWLSHRHGGVFADGLHVGKIDVAWLRVRRKVFDRKSVHEVRLTNGVLTVVGVDGKTLFSSGLLSAADRQRFADFVGGRVVEPEAPPPDPLAVAPVRTPEGVLPLSVRRAAGLLQVVGGLLVGLGVLNIPLRLPTLPESRWGFALELLGVLVAYGAIYLAFGIRLARGLPRSREMALYGTWVATAAALLALYLVSQFLPAAVMFAAIFLPICALVAYWLREPLPARAK
jgi:hypothetical protein